MYWKFVLAQSLLWLVWFSAVICLDTLNPNLQGRSPARLPVSGPPALAPAPLPAAAPPAPPPLPPSNPLSRSADALQPASPTAATTEIGRAHV